MRKLIITLFTLLASLACFAQNDNDYNFVVKDGEIIWQRVFQDSRPFDELCDVAKASKAFENVVINGSKIEGSLTPEKADIKGAGYGYMSASYLVSNSHLAANFVLQWKEGRYRVTLMDIKFIGAGMMGVSVGGIFASAIAPGEKINLDTFLRKNGKIKETFYSSDTAEILDYTFTSIFMLQSKMDVVLDSDF